MTLRHVPQAEFRMLSQFKNTFNTAARLAPPFPFSVRLAQKFSQSNVKKGDVMKIRVVHLIPLVAFAVAGCTTSKISNLNTYQKVPLQQGELMPSKSALSGAKSRVIVFGFDDKKWPGAGEEVSDKVTKELNSTNNVVIVDRALAGKLGQELQLAETKGRTGYKGQDVADFAISGKITDGGSGVAFTEARSYQDKDGKWQYVTAKCTTSGKVAFALKIVQLPSLDVIKTIDEEATASNTQDARWTYCSQLSQGEANGIVSAAIANAVQKAYTELKNQFAPSGYVLERRKHEKDNIFKMTLGETGGAKEGLTVEVVRTVAEKNPLTGVTSTEQVKIADGVISDQVGTGFSYFIVSDQEKAGMILLGDKVQIKYEISLMDRYNKLAH